MSPKSCGPRFLQGLKGARKVANESEGKRVKGSRSNPPTHARTHASATNTLCTEHTPKIGLVNERDKERRVSRKTRNLGGAAREGQMKARESMLLENSASGGQPRPKPSMQRLHQEPLVRGAGNGEGEELFLSWCLLA